MQKHNTEIKYVVYMECVSKDSRKGSTYEIWAQPPKAPSMILPVGSSVRLELDEGYITDFTVSLIEYYDERDYVEVALTLQTYGNDQQVPILSWGFNNQKDHMAQLALTGWTGIDY